MSILQDLNPQYAAIRAGKNRSLRTILTWGLLIAMFIGASTLLIASIQTEKLPTPQRETLAEEAAPQPTVEPTPPSPASPPPTQPVASASIQEIPQTLAVTTPPAAASLQDNTKSEPDRRPAAVAPPSQIAAKSKQTNAPLPPVSVKARKPVNTENKVPESPELAHKKALERDVDIITAIVREGR